MKSCPFCGSEDIEPARRIDFPVATRCRSCGAQGPSKLTGSEADAAWDDQRYANYFKRLCEDQAEDHTYLQKLCREAGCQELDVDGDSYAVPGIRSLADSLVKQLKGELK